jgi:cytochrome c biogenesis protein CcmG/thiol:disulfide interchange protein DsbE
MRRVLSPIPIAVIIGVAALVGLLAYGLSANEPDRGIEHAITKGERKRAPELDLPRLSGAGRSSLAAYRGKVVVLNFWASWCVPCRKESPLLERWHRRISRRGGTVLGVDVLDISSDARGFIRDFKLSYPMLRDKGGDTLDAFGVIAYPETFVIDRGGRIAASRRGPVDERFLRRQVAPLLGERS